MGEFTVSAAERVQLQSVVSVGYDRSVLSRAQMVLRRLDGRIVAEIADEFSTTKPTVYKWIDRFREAGMAGLDDRKPTGRPRSVTAQQRARIVALTRLAGPADDPARARRQPHRGHIDPQRAPPRRRGLTPLIGRLADRSGKRRTLLVVLGVHFAGTLVAMSAPTWRSSSLVGRCKV